MSFKFPELGIFFKNWRKSCILKYISRDIIQSLALERIMDKNNELFKGLYVRIHNNTNVAQIIENSN